MFYCSTLDKVFEFSIQFQLQVAEAIEASWQELQSSVSTFDLLLHRAHLGGKAVGFSKLLLSRQRLHGRECGQTVVGWELPQS